MSRSIGQPVRQVQSRTTTMKIFHALTILVGLFAFSLGNAHAQSAPPKAKNGVLVHGAWADGSSWAEVIPILQAAGLKVTAVQNPLTSLADSVEATRCALALQDGPTVLVAHSWGGTVISEVGTDPKVTSLVYIAARAPDADEDFVALSAKFPAGPARAGIQEHDGFTKTVLLNCPRTPSWNTSPMASTT
jgi:pimeloyl-ACP methyl ester carboxylesterase